MPWDSLADALFLLQVTTKSGGPGAVSHDFLFFGTEFCDVGEKVLQG
jgi:hypothetical protein